MATQIQTNDIEDLAITAAKLAPGAGGTGVYQRVTVIIGTPNSPYTGSTTLINLPFSYVADGKSLNVYRDGIHLEPGASADYQETSTTSITFNTAQTVGNKVLLETIVASAPATTTFDRREDYVVGTASGSYTGSTTVFDLTNTYTLGNKNVQVYVDGVLMTPGASFDYQETTSSRVTFNTALTAGQAVSFVFKQAAAANNADQVDGFNASATPTANTLLPLNANTQLAIGDGSSSLPGLSFSSDTNTGLFRGGTDSLAFVAGGVTRLIVNSTVVEPEVPVSAGTDGTPSAPFYTFSTDPDTGIYRIGANRIGIGCGGATMVDIQTIGVAIQGTNTNDSATAGRVGEFIQSTVGPTNATGNSNYFDVTSISLTAGDWDVSASGDAEANGATWTEADMGVSVTSGNSGAGLTTGYNSVRGAWASTTTVPSILPMTIAGVRLTLSATTTVYLKGRMVYSAGTPRFEGASIWARRVR